MNDGNIPSYTSSTVSLNSTSTSTSTEFDLINLPNSITPVVAHPDTTTTTAIATDDIMGADKAVDTTIAPSTKITTLLPSPFTSTPIATTTITSTDSHKRKAPPVNLIPEDESYENENSAVSKATKSSRSWNSALRNARKARGPQWDWATAQYHVDSGSAAYFAGVTRNKDENQVQMTGPTHVSLSNTDTHGSPGGTPVSSRARRAARER